MSTPATRAEHDLLGDKAVPADAYYGVQTARALENFHISGVELRLYPNVIKAFAMVKLAAARATVAANLRARQGVVLGFTRIVERTVEIHLSPFQHKTLYYQNGEHKFHNVRRV